MYFNFLHSLQVNEDVLNAIEGYCELSIPDSLKLSPISNIVISSEIKPENDIKEDMAEKIQWSVELKNKMTVDKKSFEEYVFPKKSSQENFGNKTLQPVMNSTNSLNTHIMQNLTSIFNFLLYFVYFQLKL